MERFGNRMHHSTAFTVDHTDWSLTALPLDSENVGVWFCCRRQGNTYETFYSLDGNKWILTRQGQFTERPVLYVGLCGASPSNRDFRVTFDYFSCSSCA
jgi:regulation of enolase protein 1 (concanavalin A-like superfamily)